VISPIRQKNLWFERSMAIIATVGFMVAIFDLTYIPCRDFYFNNLPVVIQQYDRVKGIEPHRETERYLNAIEQLKLTVKQTGIASAQTKSWLQQLDTLSISLIQNNPFQVAEKTGNLEKIKNQVRDRVQNQSAKGSFQTFWSQDYLIKAGWERELRFYEQRLKPLIVTNYYRRLDESGNYVDLFWQIDSIFIGIFAIEFIGRIYYLRRHNRNLSCQQAIVRRWYDLILLLPFAQFMRLIPVLIRWHQSQLVNLGGIQSELNKLFVGQIVNELTDAVVIQVLHQTQEAVKQGQIARVVVGYLKQPYIDLNNVNEIEALFQLILEILVYRIVPKIQPDLEAIFRYLFEKALAESPAYRNLKLLPGIGQLPAQAIDRVVQEVSASVYMAMLKILEDPDSGKLSRRLAENLSESIGDEIQKGQTVIKVESLIYDLLEEVKITYGSKDI
jgi:hypothetical protein